MISLYKFWAPLVSGLVAGVVLGLFMKAVQLIFKIKVYTLLLNVDYVPLLNRFPMPEWGGFAIHLGISVCLSYCLFFLANKRKWRATSRFWFIVVISIIIGLCLYPTTALSDQTPAIIDGRALTIWLFGHMLYGLVLGILLLTIKQHNK